MTTLWIEKKNRVILTAVCAVMVMILAAGCGRDEAAPVSADPVYEDTAEDTGEEQDQEAHTKDEQDQKAYTEDDKDEKSHTGQEQDGEVHTGKDRDTETDTEKERGSDSDDRNPGTQEQSGEAQQASAGTEELTGSVRSVSQDSFVISKITTYSYEGYDLAVSAAPGSEGEELVTVYVTGNCVYQYVTVKNSGINPEDISVREGTFADLKSGLTVTIKGSWQDGAFYADSMEMEEFV